MNEVSNETEMNPVDIFVVTFHPKTGETTCQVHNKIGLAELYSIRQELNSFIDELQLQHELNLIQILKSISDKLDKK